MLDYCDPTHTQCYVIKQMHLCVTMHHPTISNTIKNNLINGTVRRRLKLNNAKSHSDSSRPYGLFFQVLFGCTVHIILP